VVTGDGAPAVGPAGQAPVAPPGNLFYSFAYVQCAHRPVIASSFVAAARAWPPPS